MSNNIKIPNKFKNIDIIFNKLKNLPQPEQRTKEWYDYRYNRITASDTATAIDENPYEPFEKFIQKKCDPNYPFKDNNAVAHGKKYEDIATLIYQHIYNVKVHLFGALPSEKYDFLGASPDGICSKYTLDDKFSEKYGTMVEIKCPVTRDITKEGKIVGDICPFYYFCQVQQQLICCELDVCDFWQCKIIEYKNREEYLNDECNDTIHTVNDNIENPNDNFTKKLKLNKIEIDNKIKKGIIIQYFPKIFNPEDDNDLIEWKSKYIYPPKLNMNNEEYNIWIFNTLNNCNTLYPDIYKDYYFNKIIYWKLKESHNVSILKDNEFFNSILPILKNTWEQVLYYRTHLDEINKIIKIIEKRSKYIKINTNYTIKNDYIIKNKILFLSNKNNKTKKIDYESDVNEY